MDEETLRQRLYDIISNEVCIESVPYSDWCNKCNNAPKQLEYETVEKAAKKIVEFLNKEKLIL